MYLTEGFAMSIIRINNHFFSTNLKYLISAFQSLWLTWTSVCLHSELYNCPKTHSFLLYLQREIVLVRLALKPPQSSWLQRCYGKDFPLNEERHVHLMTTGLFFLHRKSSQLGKATSHTERIKLTEL